VGEQLSGRSEIPMLLHVIYSCGVGPNRMRTDHYEELWTNRHNKFDTFLPVFVLAMCEVCIFQLAGVCVCKSMGTVMKCDNKLQYMALTLSVPS
jgi:hypothetical protein